MLSQALTLWLFLPVSFAVPTQARKAAPPKTSKRPVARRTPTVKLGPMLFTVQGGQVKNIQQLDLKELYRAASTMYQAKKYATAIRLYKRLLKFFPKSSHRYAALYNLALAYEDSRQFTAAIKAFQQVIVENPKRTNLVLNAHFRTAACYNQLKQWKAAFTTYDRLLQGELNLDDRIDALSYAGRALYHLKHYAQALPLLKLAVNSHIRRKQKTIHYGASMAQYYWAQIHDRRFRTRKFHLPQSQMKLDLAYKSKHLLRAQKLYFRTIRLRHADWALASLYRIGDMYETMYQNMMHAPVPKDLNKEEIQIYTELLRKKIKVLLGKALLAYKLNLRLSSIVGLKSHRWKKRSQKRFQLLLSFYTKRFGGQPELLKSKLLATSKPSSRPTQKRVAPSTPRAKPQKQSALSVRKPVVRRPLPVKKSTQPKRPKPAKAVKKEK